MMQDRAVFGERVRRVCLAIRIVLSMITIKPIVVFDLPNKNVNRSRLGRSTVGCVGWRYILDMLQSLRCMQCINIYFYSKQYLSINRQELQSLKFDVWVTLYGTYSSVLREGLITPAEVRLHCDHANHASSQANISALAVREPMLLIVRSTRDQLSLVVGRD